MSSVAVKCPYIKNTFILAENKDDKINVLRKLEYVYYNLVKLGVDKREELEAVERRLDR